MEPQDLYGLPLERFTTQRNELARELRRSGDRDKAADVSKLRKPSVAAWAVNQLVRTQRREFEELLRAGDALQRAQAGLLASRGDPASLRRAVDAERSAVGLLTDKARGLLSADGHQLTSGRLEQVTETLHAAALDGDARARVQDGCLERELRHIGLGDRAEDRKGDRTAEHRSDRAAERKAVRGAVDEARRQLERALRELEKATARRDRSAQQLRDAQAAVATARRLVTEAKRQLRQAQSRLEQA